MCPHTTAPPAPPAVSAQAAVSRGGGSALAGWEGGVSGAAIGGAAVPAALRVNNFFLS